MFSPYRGGWFILVVALDTIGGIRYTLYKEKMKAFTETKGMYRGGE